MTIAHARHPREAFELLNYAFLVNQGPFALRYERGKAVLDIEEPLTDNVASLSWDTIRPGKDVAFVSFGSILNDLETSLETETLSMELVNAKFIKPLDTKKIHELIERNQPIILYEEASLQGGFCSSILEYLVANQLPTHKIHIMGIPEQFVQHGTKQELLRELNLDVTSIIQTAKDLLK